MMLVWIKVKLCKQIKSNSKLFNHLKMLSLISL